MVTSHSAWRPTPRASASRLPPPYSLVAPHGAAGGPALSFVAPHKVVDALARRAPWGRQHSRPPCPHPRRAVNALVHYVSIFGGRWPRLTTGGGLASRLVVDNSSTTRLSAATPISAHRAASREEIDGVRRNSHDVDVYIVVYAESTVMLNATQTLASDAASWFPHDAPASTPPTHPHSHLWCHCCPCLLKSVDKAPKSIRHFSFADVVRACGVR